MSSRTSAGKKRRKYTNPTAPPSQPQVIKVEMISPVLQPQAVNVEISPPPPQVNELKSKGSSINWNIFGFVSTAITLLGAALLFMLGWAYEANWYGYFGVSMSQVSIQPQDVIIQSLPGVVTIISCLVASILLYIILNIILELFHQFLKISITKKPNEEPQKVERVSAIRYTIPDWIIILIIAEGILLSILVYVYYPIVTNKFDDPQMIWTIYEITAYISFLGLATLFPLVIGTLFLGLIIVLQFAVLYVYKTIRKMFRPKEEVYIPDVRTARKPQSFFIIGFLGFLITMTSLALSATYAINDASNGVHTGTWRIQKVNVVSSAQNPFQSSIDAVCEEDKCVSEPFGLIGLNEGSYILIDWQQNDKNIFNYNPGLFFVPRTEDNYLIYTKE